MEGLGQRPGARVRPKSARDRGVQRGPRETEAAVRELRTPFLGCFLTVSGSRCCSVAGMGF